MPANFQNTSLAHKDMHTLPKTKIASPRMAALAGAIELFMATNPRTVEELDFKNLFQACVTAKFQSVIISGADGEFLKVKPSTSMDGGAASRTEFKINDKNTAFSMQFDTLKMSSSGAIAVLKQLTIGSKKQAVKIKPILLKNQFCIEFDNFISEKTVDLTYSIAKKADVHLILKLLSGIHLIEKFATHDPLKVDSNELNRVLKKHLGSGHTWISCIQSLSGAKARNINEKYQEILSGICGIVFMIFAEKLLQDAEQDLGKLLYFM
jgi:hypothetical protein